MMAVDKQSLRILGFAFAVGLRCSRPWWAMLLSALAGDAGFVSRWLVVSFAAAGC